MTSHEYALSILTYQNHQNEELKDEAAAIEVAQLISGTLIYRMYESLQNIGYDMNAVTMHLILLHDNESPDGLLYFVFILCDAANEALPPRFDIMSANPALNPYLADAIIEDWLAFHEDYGT